DASLRAKVDALPWAGLEDDWASLRSRFLAAPLAADGVALAFDEHVLARAAAKYGAALAHTAGLHRVLAGTGAPYELELSVDETSYPTTLEEHAYLALELRRLGVPVVSLAPRFVGRFEKGVDFRGDLAALVASLAGHAAVARAFGPYKLSLHSGSDKFSVYGPIAEATDGLVHLKTAGTSYLEALRVAAVIDPALFRRALAIGHERFEIDRKSYLIGARLEKVPSPDAVADADLAGLLDDDDARQVLHVTFGSALDALGTELKTLLAEHVTAHEEGLARHFVRHLAPFVPFAGTGSHARVPAAIDADVSVER
ncbi:MAG TPA: tagaturonate epimerase family protein, partial [Trueperaceae bacterium]|nr:tagaturonate epimerase family protein [Trueperaceae bacterium]